MTLEDRWTRGAVAGLAAGIVQAAFTYALKWMDIADLTWGDFASLAIHGHPVNGTAELVVAEFTLYSWLAIIGSVYPFLLDLIGKANHRLKGAAYGVLCWFVFYSIMHLFEIEEISDITPKNAVANGLAGVLWGCLLTSTYTWLLSRRDRQHR